MDRRTPLQIAFDNIPPPRGGKHINLWQVPGEQVYHAMVERYSGVGATPEDAIMQATRYYIEQGQPPSRKSEDWGDVGTEAGS